MSSCNKEEAISEDHELGKIEVRMRESIHSDPGRLFLRCETLEIFPCSNWYIINSVSSTPARIDVEFKGIYVPEICFTAMGPATADIDLGSLAEGSYNLLLFAPGSINAGKLIVSPDHYRLDFNVTGRFVFPYVQLNRVPDNAIWGHVGYHRESSWHFVQSFLDELSSMGAQPGEFLPGEYTYFKILESGERETPKLHGYYFIEPFIFDYRGDLPDLEDLVRYYGINHGDSLSISVFTWSGERYRSWTYSAGDD